MFRLVHFLSSKVRRGFIMCYSQRSHWFDNGQGFCPSTEISFQTCSLYEYSLLYTQQNKCSHTCFNYCVCARMCIRMCVWYLAGTPAHLRYYLIFRSRAWFLFKIYQGILITAEPGTRMHCGKKSRGGGVVAQVTLCWEAWSSGILGILIRHVPSALMLLQTKYTPSWHAIPLCQWPVSAW